MPASQPPGQGLSLRWRKPVLVVFGVVAVAAVWVSPGRILALERLPDRVLQGYGRAFPMDPWPPILLGERLLQEGQPRAAVEQLARVPDGTQSVRLGIALAEALCARGVYPEAERQARQLLEVVPRSGKLHRILGECRLVRGEPFAALAAFQEATRLEPQDPGGWIALAGAQVEQKGFRPEIAQVWQEGLRANPNHPLLRCGLAETYVGLGRYAEAESLLADLEHLRLPDSTAGRELAGRAWAARGAVLRRLAPTPERLQQAQQALEHSLTLLPDAPDTYYELALLRADRREWEAARAALLRAIPLRPYAHPFWYHLAGVCRRLGRQEESRRAEARFRLLVNTFETVNQETRALEAQPEDAERRLRLARLLLSRADFEAASAHAARMLERDPGNQEALRIRAAVERERRPPGSTR